MQSQETSACPTCQGPLAERPAARYPIVSQLLFVVSFLAFLAFQDHVTAPIRWLWTLTQVGMGAWVVRGRLRARKRIYRCVRCGAALR